MEPETSETSRSLRRPWENGGRRTWHPQFSGSDGLLSSRRILRRNVAANTCQQLAVNCLAPNEEARGTGFESVVRPSMSALLNALH